ncbi:MAG: hypothetical protein AAFZ15_16600 [Bacteroidota bacterium]
MINKNKRLPIALPHALLLFSAIAFFTYTFLRAHSLSMTHDESGSFYIWTQIDIFTCFVDPGCWKTANLHFLYVFLMKGMVELFGVSELTVRVPSLIGHLIYLFYSWKLIKLCTDRSWFILIGFIIINSNPFLLEFFALGRGYGLANTFMLVSIFYMGKFFKTENKLAAWGVFIGAFLSVFSNFTMLNYYACMVAVLGLVFFYLLLKKENIDWRAWKYLLGVGSVVTVLLFVLLYMPVRALSGAGEFEYGGTHFWDTFSSIVKASLYDIKYMGTHHVEVFGGLFILMLTVGVFWAVRFLYKKPNDPKAQFVFAASFLPILVALASVVQHHLLGVNYLRGRTALIFVPLASVALFLFLENILNRNNKWRWALPIIIGLFCTVHAFRSYQLSYAYEWKYDARTRDMVEYIVSIIPKGEKTKLGMNWLFQPTAYFYHKNTPYDFADKLYYEKQYRTDIYYDYYYIRPGDQHKINSRYKVLKKYSFSGVLMVRDSL